MPPALRQSSRRRRSRRRQISRGIDDRINRGPIQSDYDFNTGANQESGANIDQADPYINLDNDVDKSVERVSKKRFARIRKKKMVAEAFRNSILMSPGEEQRQQVAAAIKEVNSRPEQYKNTQKIPTVSRVINADLQLEDVDDWD